MKSHLGAMFYAVKNIDSFRVGIKTLIDSCYPHGTFTGDNLIVLARNLSFLDNESFMTAFNKSMVGETEQSLIWRTYVLCWAAKNGLRLEGDFVECACYKGDSARVVCDYLKFSKCDKKYYLYDLFEHELSMDHHHMLEHSGDLYQKVKRRFVDHKNVVVTQGAVPEILHQVAPEKISFLHLDLNGAAAEIGALELLFDKIVPGGILVLDDYGWLAYREQKEAEDIFFAERGYQVLELPTGQGLVIA